MAGVATAVAAAVEAGAGWPASIHYSRQKGKKGPLLKAACALARSLARSR